MSVEKLIKYRQFNVINKNSDYECNNDSKDNNDIKAVEAKYRESKLKVLQRIRERLIENYSIGTVNTVEKFDVIRNAAWSMIDDEINKSGLDLYMDSYDKAEILEMLIQNIFGYGILDSLINDPSITEIMVNGLNKIFIERGGKIEQARNKRGEYLKFNSNDELLYLIEKIVAPINRKVDESTPIVDARLPNGFRVNIVLNPVSLDGHLVTIRKFPESPYNMEKLVEFGTLPGFLAEFLKNLVLAKYNIIISGGTGSGKTTFLNALSNYIREDERIITIEDAAELKLTGIKNLARLETRPPNIEGKGEITMRDLVKTALRMRPDRIIIGEVRGGEALDMLQAMNTGHDGSLSTGHANSSIDMLSRLETMVLMAGVDLPLLSIRQQIASAVEIIIHLSKMQDGSRKVVQVTEILGANNEGYITQDLFEYKKFGLGEEKSGCIRPTGKQLKRIGKLYGEAFSHKPNSQVENFLMCQEE